MSIKGAQTRQTVIERGVCTCVDSLVAGEVALVAESSLAAVTLVWLVAVYLKHVLFQRFVLRELRVTFVTEERAVFCSGEMIEKVQF